MDPLGLKAELPRINAGAPTGLSLRERCEPSALQGERRFSVAVHLLPVQTLWFSRRL